MPLSTFLRELPKAELHVHLEGSIMPSLALKLARRHQVRLPGDERGEQGLIDAYVFRSFHDFLRLYVRVSKCLNTVQDVREVVVDLARAHQEQGVRYAEVTFTPLTHRQRGVGADVLWAGLQEGRAEARSRHGVHMRWVFDVVRSVPESAEATVDFAIGMNARDPDAVVGLGVGGPEADHYPMEGIAVAFDRGRAQGFKSLPHAGENAGAQSMWTALKRLHADRIGHGVRCFEDPALVEHLREHQIALEVCPSSNVVLGVCPSWEEHPLPRLLEEGVAVSLGSDDPPMFGTTLLTEYERCATTFGWGAQKMKALAANAVRQSFAPDDLKETLLAEQAALATPD